MGGPKPGKKSRRTKGAVAVLRLSKGSGTPRTAAPLDTGLTVEFGLHMTNRQVS